MNKPIIKKENVEALLDTKFIKAFDLQYEEGKHYYDATRRRLEDLVAIKTDEEFKTMLPDAVSCFVIIKVKDEEPKLLLSYEYRYPAGRFLLSVPAGLIDPADKNSKNPLFETAVREIKEETGIKVKETDKLTVVNPLAFSTPGMSDESNALVCAVISLDNTSILTQTGAEGSECFNGFALLTKEEAKEILNNGRDKFGNFYSMFTWGALTYFVADLWK
jgi:ADP-ribose pyrophosphatase